MGGLPWQQRFIRGSTVVLHVYRAMSWPRNILVQHSVIPADLWQIKTMEPFHRQYWGQVVWDGLEHLWAFMSTKIPSWIEPENNTLMPSAWTTSPCDNIISALFWLHYTGRWGKGGRGGGWWLRSHENENKACSKYSPNFSSYVIPVWKTSAALTHKFMYTES